MLGIELSTADGSAHDGALFGMELDADNGTSDGALLDHVTLLLYYLDRLMVILRLVLLLMT